MKCTTNKLKGKRSLERLWERYVSLLDAPQNGKTIDKENKLLEEIEKALPFKDQQEHQKWLEVSETFKFWEDFEELTLSIINRAENERVDHYLEAYNLVAQDICQDANFYDLFNAFSKLSNGWVKPIEGDWKKWEEELKKDENDWKSFTEEFKEFYGKDYELMEFYRMGYYGFETSIFPMFYKNDEDGKSDLIDCIFERYVDGLDEDRELWFYQRLIKELI